MEILWESDPTMSNNKYIKCFFSIFNLNGWSLIGLTSIYMLISVWTMGKCWRTNVLFLRYIHLWLFSHKLIPHSVFSIPVSFILIKTNVTCTGYCHCLRSVTHNSILDFGLRLNRIWIPGFLHKSLTLSVFIILCCLFFFKEMLLNNNTVSTVIDSKHWTSSGSSVNSVTSLVYMHDSCPAIVLETSRISEMLVPNLSRRPCWVKVSVSHRHRHLAQRRMESIMFNSAVTLK